MNDSSDDRLQQLLDIAIEHSCSEAERQELARLLEQDAERRRTVIEQLFVHSLLQWQSEDISEELQALKLTATGHDTSDVSAMTPGRRSATSVWIWAAAALLFFATGMAGWQAFRSRPGQGALVAEIADSRGVIWSDHCTALKDGHAIVPGRLEMKSGALTLRFRSGPTLTATGDASMQIDSDMHVRLDRGQATAYVPQWAKGFTIETADAKVVDLGTRFGVVAGIKNRTDVVVFEGQVDVTPTSRRPSVQMRLTQGEAARIDSQGAVSRIVEVHRDHLGERWSTTEQASADSVFKSISDNIQPSDSSKYYQITPRGLVDDAPAYVDRPHEWNGLTAAGLPDFLQQADYVRTFNDYKYLNQLRVVVELSRPAMVYIFFDDRVPAPNWLTEQFENAGVRIGLDEGPWPEIDPADPTLRTAVGSGRSIDHIFSVWRRRCDTAETLVLGSMGEMPGARAIYGIAAKPLD
jgi:hypothetical protein